MKSECVVLLQIQYSLELQTPWRIYRSEHYPPGRTLFTAEKDGDNKRRHREGTASPSGIGVA